MITDFQDHVSRLRNLFLNTAYPVETEKWQGIETQGRKDMISYEILNVTTYLDLQGNEDLEHWRSQIKPNLPWADDHFEERVCGKPLNPGEQWKKWPWARSAARFIEGGKFNHTYMTRYWPKEDHPTYGDMIDLVNLLVEQPMTRQAWIPIFFPEDTGVGDGGRKPCSLGYQFIIRGQEMHCYYPLRSCDFIRHYADDVYLTIRLMLWVLETCRRCNPFFDNVKPGSLFVHCTSLHLFTNDMIELKKG